MTEDERQLVTIVDGKSLTIAINSVLETFGFKRKGSNCYLPCADVVLVMSLRKSTHGNYYYLDGGVNLMALASDMEPRSNDCHIKFNFNLLAGEDFQIIGKALDMEISQSDDVATLISLIREQCLPQLLGMSSLAALRDMYKQGRLQGTFLLKQARELLESNEPYR